MASLPAPASFEPGRNCPLCPRLAEFRAQARAKAAGLAQCAGRLRSAIANAQLLIVGLAPGMQGANRTGRPFTGDYAGDLLYATLLEYGFAKGVYQARPDDGLKLVDCRISNAVRCVPPQNKPLPAEINTCRQFLVTTIATMPKLRAIVALGRIAHESTLKALGLRNAAAPFGHGAVHERRRHQALRQLSLLALQHEYAGADAGDVSQRVCEGAQGSGFVDL